MSSCGLNSLRAAGGLPGLAPGSQIGREFKAHLSAIESCSSKDDLNFQERSVRDVSDAGRAQGAARLQAVLQEVLKRAVAPKGSPPASLGELQLPESEVRREVQSLVRRLQELRDLGNSAGRNMEVGDVLRRLERLPVSAKCLKVSKVAVELNQPCWRASEAADIRERASALVRRWRAEFRARHGSPEETLSMQARRCRNLSMDLEEGAYGRSQGISAYADLVEALCLLLRRDPSAATGLMTGAVTGKDLVGRVAARCSQRKVRTIKKVS
mmetsp:Transcript_63075/g.137043  ORF Transcript_63075/g.137043 Transcript_63075/m.137043 type:complete len:270 (+) Transcript_63075:66-875(+)